MATDLFVADVARLSARERALLRHLEREYTPELVRDVLRPLVTQTSPVSLRALDWAVVNWSKQHNVVCAAPAPGVMTNVHHAYRTSLAYWKRRLFDPFRRRARVGLARAFLLRFVAVPIWALVFLRFCFCFGFWGGGQPGKRCGSMGVRKTKQ